MESKPDKAVVECDFARDPTCHELYIPLTFHTSSRTTFQVLVLYIHCRLLYSQVLTVLLTNLLAAVIPLSQPYMGSSQSTMPESVTGDQLAERLEALDVQSPSDKDYIYIKNDMETPRTPDSANDMSSTPREPTLSIRTAEHWEKLVLQDPKVRLMLPSNSNGQCLASTVSADHGI